MKHPRSIYWAEHIRYSPCREAIPSACVWAFGQTDRRPPATDDRRIGVHAAGMSELFDDLSDTGLLQD